METSQPLLLVGSVICRISMHVFINPLVRLIRLLLFNFSSLHGQLILGSYPKSLNHLKYYILISARARSMKARQNLVFSSVILAQI